MSGSADAYVVEGRAGDKVMAKEISFSLEDVQRTGAAFLRHYPEVRLRPLKYCDDLSANDKKEFQYDSLVISKNRNGTLTIAYMYETLVVGREVLNAAEPRFDLGDTLTITGLAGTVKVGYV